MKGLKSLLKQQKEELKAKAGDVGDKSWLPRSVLGQNTSVSTIEVELAQKKAEEAEKQRLKELAEHLSEKKRHLKDEAKRDAEAEADDDVSVDSARKKRRKLLPLNEIQAILRSYGQPKKLFGETHEESFGRMLEVEKTEDRAAIIRESHRNHQSVDIDEEELMDSPRGISCTDVSDIPHDLEDNTKIKVFIQTCLKRWSQELDQRDEEEKKSLEGKRQSQTYTQTRQHLKPLLKRIKSGRLEEEVTSKLSKIIDYCIDKEYVKAHDKYIELAIGNAAWPMGVTMVGIHERVGRSKIFSSEIAHILNDETTRKYIQMIKRLVTLCQTWHPTDPSRMVTISSTTPLGHQVLEADE